MQEKFLRIKDVESMMGCKKTKIWSLTKSGQFPQPRRLPGRITVWLLTEVTNYMQQIANN